MKCIFFSDIHGNKYSFDNFLKSIENECFDKIFFLGDFVGYYYHSIEIIEKCINFGVFSLLGNHDSYFLKMIEGDIDESELVMRYGNSYRVARQSVSEDVLCYLKSLKSSASLELAGKKVLLCHGSPIDPLEGRVYPDTDLKLFNSYLNFDYIILGHTHHKMERKYFNTWFLNPGSLGQQRDGKGCSYLEINFDSGHSRVKAIDYDIFTLEKEVDKFDPEKKGFKEVLRR